LHMHAHMAVADVGHMCWQPQAQLALRKVPC